MRHGVALFSAWQVKLLLQSIRIRYGTLAKVMKDLALFSWWILEDSHPDTSPAAN